MIDRDETTMIVIPNRGPDIARCILEADPSIVSLPRSIPDRIRSCESCNVGLGDLVVITRRSGELRIMLFVHQGKSR